MSKDLRIEKTENALKLSLRDLIISKPYDEITITELCKKAKVNRNTFYLHYNTKDDLVENILDDLLLEIIKFERIIAFQSSVVTNENGVIFIITQLFQYIKTHKVLLSAIEKDSSLTGYLDNFTKKISDTFLEHFNVNNERKKIAINFAVFGLLSVIKNYLRSQSDQVKEDHILETSRIIVMLLS